VPTFPNDAPWSPLAVQGPLARTIEDIALMMKVMSGQDLRVPLSYPIDMSVWDFEKRHNLNGLRIAYSTDFGGLCDVSAEMQDAVRETAEAMRSLGATVVEAIPDFGNAETVFKNWRAWEFVQGFGAFYKEHRSDLKQAIQSNVEFGLALTIQELAETSTLHSQLHLNTFDFFTKFDALILPSTPVVPFAVELEYPPMPNGLDYPSYLEWMSTCYLVTAAGNPSLAIPASLNSAGLPRGIQLVGQHKNDAGLLSIGYAFEQATGYVTKHPPKI
jgi:amidase